MFRSCAPSLGIGDIVTIAALLGKRVRMQRKFRPAHAARAALYRRLTISERLLSHNSLIQQGCDAVNPPFTAAWLYSPYPGGMAGREPKMGSLVRAFTRRNLAAIGV